MPPQKNSNRDTLIKVIASVVVLSVVGFAFSRMDTIPRSEVVSENNIDGMSTENLPSDDTEPIYASDRTYRNGTYTATGEYSSPAGKDEVHITLIINNDIITNGSVVIKGTNPSSIKYQTLFKEGFNQYVIGKNVDDMKIEVVNGSSLTPKGFMDALVKIKTEAAV